MAQHDEEWERRGPRYRWRGRGRRRGRPGGGYDYRVDAGAIEVEVNDREITLGGTVDSRQTKRPAENVVESVRGVWDIHNRLQIRRKEEDRGA